LIKNNNSCLVQSPFSSNTPIPSLSKHFTKSPPIKSIPLYPKMSYQPTTNTTNAGAQGTGSANAGSKVSNLIKEGLTKFHGAGEAIRGNVNTFADNVTNTDDTRSRAEVERGINEMSTGKYEGAHTAGVTPKDTTQERIHEPTVGHTTGQHAAMGTDPTVRYA
jgi:hypothetical protein